MFVRLVGSFTDFQHGLRSVLRELAYLQERHRLYTLCSTYPCGLVPNEYRSAGSHYGEELQRSVPEELGGLDDGHMDVLSGHQAALAAVMAMTVTDAELRVKLVDGTLLKSDLGQAGN